jgi:hypothetical protein
MLKLKNLIDEVLAADVKSEESEAEKKDEEHTITDLGRR